MSAQEYESRSGWLTFAAILMFAVGFARIVSAIRYFDDGQEIKNLSAGLFGDSLWAWGSGISASPRSPCSEDGPC